VRARTIAREGIDVETKSKTSDRCSSCKSYTVYVCGYSPHRGASSCKQCNMTGKICTSATHKGSAWKI